jgi:hypothetical protein
MDQRIDDYIRSNRDRYNREAITQQLEAAGYQREAIHATWERLATNEPQDGAEGHNLALYVWILYWLGAGIILAITVIAVAGSGGGFGFTGFGIGWLVAYLLLTYLPARAMARARPTGTGGKLAVIVGVPLLVLLIGGGICFGTIAVFVAGMGG